MGQGRVPEGSGHTGGDRQLKVGTHCMHRNRLGAERKQGIILEGSGHLGVGTQS